MKNDELVNLKSLAVRLDEGKLMIVCLQYHAERLPDGRFNKEKSMYRWIARVTTDEAVSKCIDELYKDENTNVPFKWPDDPDEYYLSCKYSRGYDIASWLETKMKKIKPWDEALKVFAGFKPKTKTCKEGYNEKSKFKTEGYKTPDGQVVSITDREEMLKRVGQNMILYVDNLK